VPKLLLGRGPAKYGVEQRVQKCPFCVKYASYVLQLVASKRAEVAARQRASSLAEASRVARALGKDLTSARQAAKENGVCVRVCVCACVCAYACG